LPTWSGLQAIAECVKGVKHCGVTPSGLGPAEIHSLSLPGTLPSRTELLSWMKLTVPSPGWRGSPGPPQTARSLGGGAVRMATHGRDQVKPPLVDRLTHTPLVSSVRLKLMSAW